MYTESTEQMARLRDRSGDFERLAKASAQERADAFSDFYLPVTPEAGNLLYALVRASRPSTVVEFGMSLGISAIHLPSSSRSSSIVSCIEPLYQILHPIQERNRPYRFP